MVRWSRLAFFVVVLAMGISHPLIAAIVSITSPTNGASLSSATVTLTAAQLASIVDQLTYINIHSSGFSSGEIRGQLVR